MRPMPKPARHTIVVIDDDADHLRFMTALLEGAGYRVRAFRESHRALEYIELMCPDLVITDIFMPLLDGFEVLRHVKRTCPFVPVVTMSDSIRGHETHYLESTTKQGASLAFQKPIAPSELIDAIQQLVERD